MVSVFCALLLLLLSHCVLEFVKIKDGVKSLNERKGGGGRLKKKKEEGKEEIRQEQH